MSEARIDRLLDGRLSLRQPADGHRAGTDAMLLAASVTTRPGAAIADVGSGVGTIGLALALREATAAVTLIEREHELAGLARDNGALNGVSDRVRVVEADVFDRATIAPLLDRATLVVSNPPFFAAGSVRTSPHRLRWTAHEIDGGPAAHGQWLRAMLGLACPHAEVALVHRPDALPMLLAAAEGRLGAVRVRPVLPRDGASASRILMGGIVGSRAPFTLLAPIVLHGPDGDFTPLAEAIGRGAALIPLFDSATRKSRPRGPALS